jgi:hypothetical protein
MRLKQDDLLRYEWLAGEYTAQFERKWFSGGGIGDEPLLGSADVQSLADLGGSYELIKKMRILPVTWNDFILFAIPGLLPAIPLLALVMPLSEILKQLLRLIS